MKQPFTTVEPRKLTRASLDKGGWMLYGGRVYLDENGKATQTAAYFPDDADHGLIADRIESFHKVELEKGGMSWFPVSTDERPSIGLAR